jgi:D-arabinose 1-dehydrogenase-like Zn-dependent alcohol dehydrogenase
VPEPGPGQVLIRMQTSGLCHTDIHAAAGDWPVKPAPPFIPGHEGVGIVQKTGPGATLHQPGERVAIAWLGSACGHCLADVFALHLAGRTKVVAQECHLDDVNTCIEDVLAGRVPARLVFTF